MVGAEAGTDRSGAMITYPMRTYPNVVMRALAIERIELGRRVCDAMEPESLPLRVGRDARLGATLAAFAAVSQRGEQASGHLSIASTEEQTVAPDGVTAAALLADHIAAGQLHLAHDRVGRPTGWPRDIREYIPNKA